ncbi:MAG: hypothetical protein OXE87_04990 [Chloroflexi bacterium]|nr:hypothetical protein [Chloroflexota bacterium]
MNAVKSNLIGRRKAILLLAMTLAMAGVMWFSMLNGVGTASADGGLDSGAVGNGVIQDQHEQPPINACLLPGIPC